MDEPNLWVLLLLVLRGLKSEDAFPHRAVNACPVRMCKMQGDCRVLQGKWKKAFRRRVELPALNRNPSKPNKISASDQNLPGELQQTEKSRGKGRGQHRTNQKESIDQVSLGFVHLAKGTGDQGSAGGAGLVVGAAVRQPPCPALQRHTRVLRVISFPVVEWSKCVSMQDWGPGNHGETGFLFLLQTTAAPVDWCRNVRFPPRKTSSCDYYYFFSYINDSERNFWIKIATRKKVKNIVWLSK